MKIGNNREYIVNLGSIFDPLTAAASVNSMTLSQRHRYSAGLFVPKQNMQVNRIAFYANNSATSTITCGIASTDLNIGLPFRTPATDGIATDIIFINSSTSFGQVVTNDYNIVSLTNTNLVAGLTYFAVFQNTFPGTTTSSVSIGFSAANSRNIISFPYSITSPSAGGTVDARVNTQHSFMLGYNNGSFTQWYGNPFAGWGSTTFNNTTAVTGVAYAGSKINLPPVMKEYAVKGITAQMVKHPGQAILCRIFESDNSTQVANATSLISTTMSTFAFASVLTTRPYGFYFGGDVRLKPNKNYYIRFSALGSSITAANFGSSLGYTITQSSAISTSMSVSQFQNAYSCVNKLIVSTNDGVVFEYQNARPALILECQSFVSDYRGTKENRYVGF